MKKLYRDLGPTGRVMFGGFVFIGICAVTVTVLTIKKVGDTI